MSFELFRRTPCSNCSGFHNLAVKHVARRSREHTFQCPIDNQAVFLALPKNASAYATYVPEGFTEATASNRGWFTHCLLVGSAVAWSGVRRILGTLGCHISPCAHSQR